MISPNGVSSFVILPSTPTKHGPGHPLESGKKTSCSAPRGPGRPRGSGVKKPLTPSTLFHRPRGRPPGRPSTSANRRRSEPSPTLQQRPPTHSANTQATERQRRRERREAAATNSQTGERQRNRERPEAAAANALVEEQQRNRERPEAAAANTHAANREARRLARERLDPPPPYQELPNANALDRSDWTQRALALTGQGQDPREVIFLQLKGRLVANHAIQAAAQVSLSADERKSFAITRMEERAGLLMQHTPAGVLSENFSYLTASGPTHIPTGLPVLSMNRYQDMRYTDHVVSTYVATWP